MSKSTRQKRVEKPRPDFPLFPHASGRWCKKVKGKFRYFGRVADDPKGKAALDLWLNQKDALLAGREPRAASDADVALKDVCNAFVSHKRPSWKLASLPSEAMANTSPHAKGWSKPSAGCGR